MWVNIIHCFKSGKPCSLGASLLKTQVKTLNKDDVVNYNPFKATNSDVNQANTDDEDDFIDME